MGWYWMEAHEPDFLNSYKLFLLVQGRPVRSLLVRAPWMALGTRRGADFLPKFGLLTVASCVRGEVDTGALFHMGYLFHR